MEDIQREYIAELARRGMAGRIVSIERIHDLQADIEAPRQTGILSQGIANMLSEYLNFQVPSELADAKCILILAYPEPVTTVHFSQAGKTRSVVIPPIYLPKSANSNFRNLLADKLEKHGFRTAPARLPLKTLAVRSGLGQYGRNNVCYVPGMGSLLRLEAFYTNAPLGEQAWGEKGVMDACAQCGACQANCPTGCIAPERFVIHAERCLTFFNELEPDFPNWIHPSWHNALIGCMRCQAICPQNLPHLKNVLASVSFNDDETTAILAATDLEQLPAELCEKLRQLHWSSQNHALMRRNLAALLS